MLVIRQEQMQAMIAADETQLDALVTDAVHAANAERVKDYGADVMSSMIKTAIARARSHDLTKAEDIAAFAAVMFEVAPNFDEQPDVKLVLGETTFPPSERFYQLF